MERKSLTNKLAQGAAITTLAALPTLANAALTTSSSYNPSTTDIQINNNTGAELDELAFDLSSLIDGTYSLQLDGGFWLENGDLSDQYHTFAPFFSSDNLQDGQNTTLNIAYDTLSLANDHGITDLLALPTQNYSDLVTGENLVGDQFTADVELRNFNAVPVPAAAWLFGSALLGLSTIKRKDNQYNLKE